MYFYFYIITIFTDKKYIYKYPLGCMVINTTHRGQMVQPKTIVNTP